MTRAEKQRDTRAKNWEHVRSIERKSHQKNAHKREAYRKKRWSENGEELRAYYREYFRKNKEKRKAALRRYNEKHKILINARGRHYYHSTIPYQKARSKKYHAKNKEKRYKKIRACRLRNIEKYRETRNRWRRKQYKNNPAYRIANTCRAKIHTSLRRQKVNKSNRSLTLLGCSWKFFKSFLEAQFENGMTWDNYGSYWNIDHRIPVSSFDLKISENQAKAFHYSNCKPMVSVQNFSKWTKMPGPHQAILL